jgi:prephenate dehydrogenase (NADP+)
MGTAWHNSAHYPWETSRYIGGIETVKVNIALRIYSAKWHVYAGLAILNPAARIQIDQYARSVTDIFKLMIEERHDELKARIGRAKAFVFGVGEEARRPIFVSDQVFNAFTVGRPAPDEEASLNSHLSLLAMVDCWATLKIRPFLHLELAATPIFRLWFGVVEYLFRDEARLGAAIHAAAFDKTHRSEDLEFAVAARGWSQCVSFGSFKLYRRRFEETAAFFAPRFEESSKVNARMIKEMLADQTSRP